MVIRCYRVATPRHARFVLGLVAGTTLALAPLASAQDVIDARDPWTPNPLTVTAGSGLFGNAAGTFGSGTSGSVRGLQQIFGSTSATQNGDMTHDRFHLQTNTYSQLFRMTQAGDIIAPLNIDMGIAFAGAPMGNNASEARVNITAQLWQEPAGGGALVNTGLTLSFNRAFTSPANSSTRLTHTQMLRWNNQPAFAGGSRLYEVRLVTTITGSAFGGGANAANNGPNGSSVSLNFQTDATTTAAGRAAWNGIGVSVGAVPAGHSANERDRVRAPFARATYGVDGTNANTATIEFGVAYTNHDSLPAARYTVLGGAAAGEYQREHALAVASLIAGQDISAANAGIAPRARIVGASIGEQGGVLNALNTVRNHYGANNPIAINFSSSSANTTVQQLDQFLAANPRITFVGAAGNEQVSGPGTPLFDGNVEQPNYARNLIVVGSLNASATRPSSFSSQSASAANSLPHIMAPGEYVNSAQSRDTDNSGARNDFGRTFIGDNWRYQGGANTGDISGTSFATPIVTGAVALMHDYAARNQATHDDDSVDHRVIKATMLAGADRWSVQRRNGDSWAQVTSGSISASDTLLVSRSLDPQLGAGVLDTAGALRIFSSAEARDTDDATGRNIVIDETLGRPNFWDRQTISAAAGGIDGTVDYMLPSSLVSSATREFANFDLTTAFSWLRACLTWDQQSDGTTYSQLANLELRLYADNPNIPANQRGFDPDNPMDDILLAQTDGAGENVRLFDLDVGFFTINGQQPITAPGGFSFGGTFYLQVRNLSDVAVTYGLGVTLIPTPATLSVLVGAGLLAARRRRA